MLNPADALTYMIGGAFCAIVGGTAFYVIFRKLFK